MQINPVLSRKRNVVAVLRVARHLAVASASLLLIASALGYVLSPVQEALGADVAIVASRVHHEAIEGKVQSKDGLRGFVIRIVERKGGHKVVIATVKVGRNGRFHIPVRPGRYEVTIKHADHHVTKNVRVTRGHSEFIVVKVIKRAGGWGIVPVIFNY